jgi:hypothetical protein
MDEFLKQHSGELTILLLCAMLCLTLLVLVPHLLRAHLKTMEMKHEEHMRALEQGMRIPGDERSLLAGRTALLVPSVCVITAGTVTCFLAAYEVENVFSISLAALSVAAVVSLAAITGCVALLGRLAQLESDAQEEEFGENPLKK